MKLLSSALALCMLTCCLAKAETSNKCGCNQPKPNPGQKPPIVKPAPQRTADATPPTCPPTCPPETEQKNCPGKPRA